MKTIKKTICICTLLSICFTQLHAQANELDTAYRKIASKLLFGAEANTPMTTIGLTLTKDPTISFKARIKKFTQEKVWHFLDLDGSLKTNNGYAPLFGGGKVNANPKFNLSYSLMPIKGKVPNKGADNQEFHFFWLNFKTGYEYSEYTTILNYSTDTILFANQISDSLYHRPQASIGINYLATWGKDKKDNSFKHTVYTNLDLIFKFNDNNASTLQDIKATTYKIYYDSSQQKQRMVEDKDNVSGKSDTITAFNSFSLSTNFTYVYRTTKSNYIALNLNASPQFNLSDGSVIFPLGLGLYFPVMIPKTKDDSKAIVENNDASILNLGFVFKVSNVLTLGDDRAFKDRIDFGIALTIPLSKLAPNL